MVKLFFAILAGPALLATTLALRLEAPVVTARATHLVGGARMRLAAPSWLPSLSALLQAGGDHAPLALRVCEGAAVCVVCASVVLLIVQRVRGRRQARKKPAMSPAAMEARRLILNAARRKGELGLARQAAGISPVGVGAHERPALL